MSDEEKQPLNPSAPPAYTEAPPPAGGGGGGGFPPPQGAPPPQQPQPQYQAVPAQQSNTTTTVITQPAIMQNVKLGEFPVTVTCPSGGHQITTNVEYQNGTMTYIIALVLCLFLGPCCAIIPFFVDSLKDVVHTCPIDGTVIGIYKRA